MHLPPISTTGANLGCTIEVKVSLNKSQLPWLLHNLDAVISLSRAELANPIQVWSSTTSYLMGNPEEVGAKFVPIQAHYYHILQAVAK